ncbi:GW domain-containing glycosaminoglycan-binding protein, partial [Listeria monocytogenes]|uniref:GW domain-containing glycosaminoglycan-binding protein n=1 Tax=Listeria monocytogenes TaxID=1639 RepID=UPI0021CD7C59
YVASNLSIPGYRSTEPSNYKGVADHPGIVVTYVYQKIAGGTITVKYVDENSKVIAPKTEINGDLNSTYNITLKDIPGYTYVKGEDIGIPMTGVFNGDDKVKVFTYKSNTKDVEKFVYQFMDREGKEIAPSIFTHDEVDVNLLLKTFPIKVGYQLNLELSRIKNGVIKTGSIDKKVQTFKLIYDESIESNQVITAYSRVKTINNMSVWTQPEKTNGANKVDALSFYAGKNLRILREAKTISGTYYQFSIDGKTIGWIDSKALDTFYTPSMEKNLTATRYVAPGQETQHYYELPVADSAIDRGPLSKFSGQTLTVQREATIEGELWYRVKGLGWTKASNLTATQYDKPEYDKATTSYNRVKTATVKPTIPGTQQIPTKQSGALKIKATHQEQPIVAENLKLPTTGDNLWDSVLYSVFGFITVCLSFVLFFRRKKQKNS